MAGPVDAFKVLSAVLLGPGGLPTLPDGPLGDILVFDLGLPLLVNARLGLVVDDPPAMLVPVGKMCGRLLLMGVLPGGGGCIVVIGELPVAMGGLTGAVPPGAMAIVWIVGVIPWPNC